ncbi:MAG: LysR family transcriptional regulator [Bacteriovoracaceae bacterium]|nr:LysR family transcriptional regulator [Bacteriovoracaceae bacterium]
MKITFDFNRSYWFIRIVDSGNITRAAELLNEPKAKLSRNLSLLEEELGVQLVYRTTRQFKLTEAGLLFYQKAKTHIDGILEAANQLSEEKSEISGLIKITAPDDIGVYVITRIISEFSSIYPKVSFELIYSNEVLDLVKLGVDLAVRMGSLKDSILIQKRVGNVKFILVASPKYLDRNQPISSPEELHEHQTVGFSSKSPIWELISKNKTKTIKLKHKYVANNFIAIRDLALRGHGIAFLPAFLCDSNLANGDLIHVLKNWGDEGSPIQIAIPHQKNVSKKIKTFRDFLSKKLAENF